MSIATRQDEPHSIDLMAAQRQLYSEAKRCWALRLLGSIGIAAAAPIIVLAWDTAGPWLGAVAGMWLIAARFVFRPREQTSNDRAAMVQEEFDTYVLAIPWNPACGDHLQPQQRAAATRRHFSRHESERRAALQRWYPDTGALRRPYDTLVCQQSNLSWTSQLHTEWTVVLTGFAVLLVLLGAVLALQMGLSFGQWLLALFAPTLPAIVDVADEWELHRRRAELQGAADRDARARWTSAIEGTAEVSVQDCRNIQDSILRLRREPVLVPERFYSMRKRAFETDMQSAAQEFVDAGQHAGLV